MTSTHEPPDGAALRQGLLDVTAMYIQDADLARAAGETGVIEMKVTVTLDHGRVRFTKGSVAFERRIEIGGRA